MDIQTLQQAGLTPGESRVYLALLKLGETTVGPGAKEANISLSKIYEVLDNLIKKGLASSITINNIKHFKASDPALLLDYLEKKKQTIQDSKDTIKKILPQLHALQKKENNKPATVYEGFKGIQSFYESILDQENATSEIHVIGIPREVVKRYDGYFLDWNKRRVQKNIPLKVIYNADVGKLSEKRAQLNLTSVKYFPKHFVTPAWIIVYNTTTAIIHMTDKPICVVIQDKNVATTYENFFTFIWDISSSKK